MNNEKEIEPFHTIFRVSSISLFPRVVNNYTAYIKYLVVMRKGWYIVFNSSMTCHTLLIKTRNMIGLKWNYGVSEWVWIIINVTEICKKMLKQNIHWHYTTYHRTLSLTLRVRAKTFWRSKNTEIAGPRL